MAPVCSSPAMVSCLSCGMKDASEGLDDSSSRSQQSSKLDPGLWCYGDSYYRNSPAALSKPTGDCGGFVIS